MKRYTTGKKIGNDLGKNVFFTAILGWIFYFAAYVLTERLIPYDRCVVIHSVLDDWIPFCEYFVVPYVLWYAWVAGSLAYFLFFHRKTFQKLERYIIIIQVVAMAVYVVFPNRQDLRPHSFPRENVFTWMVALLYRIDTSTNVCPSMHVGISVAIASVWTKERGIAWVVKAANVMFGVLVCLSTVFLKQHSVIDGLAAGLLCLLVEGYVFRKKGSKDDG